MIGKPEIVRVLLRHPSLIVNLPTKMGWSAFHYACSIQRPDCARQLLAHSDIDVNLLNKVR
jgi:ankyrin repeat protein